MFTMHHLSMINRVLEFEVLERVSQKNGLLVLFGRRRVGKTRLVMEWLKRKNGIYSQAIEGNSKTQLEQIYFDVSPFLSTTVPPKTWPEFFELLSIEKKKLILCIDEFPYLVASDPSLPSRFQKWLDHQNQNVFLILMGSSSHMMNNLFLNHSAPLFGRAQKIIQLQPMNYLEFCKALGNNKKQQSSFTKFSLVGGIPRYWEALHSKQSVLDLADDLYFGFAPLMESEPRKLLGDEQLQGQRPLHLLEVIGRGAHQIAEMARRLEVPQTHLSRLIQQLQDASLIRRDIPFGESEKNSKKSFYFISDPAICFWFSVFSPHRVLWKTYSEEKKLDFLHRHASVFFEHYCRKLYPSSARYWEKNVELDLVRLPSDQERKKYDIIVCEVKYKNLSEREKTQTLFHLQTQWNKTVLSKKYFKPKFEVLDFRRVFLSD